MFLWSLKLGLLLKKNESVFLKIHRCMINSIQFIIELRYLSSIKPGDYCPQILNGQTQMICVCSADSALPTFLENSESEQIHLCRNMIFIIKIWLFGAFFDLSRR